MRRLSVVAAVAMFGALFAGTAGPASAGGSCFEPARSWAGVAVDLKGNCFFPTVLYVDRNTKVTWTNREGVQHTVTGLGVQWGSTEPLGQGQSMSYRFTRNGVYPFSCMIHPGMVGAVVVGRPTPGTTPADFAVPPEVVPSTSPVAQHVASGPAVRPAGATVAAAPSGWRAAALAGWALFLLTALAMAFTGARRRHVRDTSTAE
jgi:plastocyanin